jgi:hypothetical protein
MRCCIQEIIYGLLKLHTFYESPEVASVATGMTFLLRIRLGSIFVLNFTFYVLYKSFRNTNHFRRDLKAEICNLHGRKVGISDGGELKYVIWTGGFPVS